MNFKTKIKEWAVTFTHDNVFMYSAQASFYIIISSIPFVMMLISLAQYILPISESDVLIMVSPLLPDMLAEPFENIIHEIFYKVSGSVISITAISSLWTASRGIQAIERGTRNVYHTPKRATIFRDILASFLYTLIFIFILIIFLAIFVFGNSIASFLELKSGFLSWLFSKTSWLKWVFTFAIFIFAFSLIYSAFSGRKFQPKKHITGAVFTTFGWSLFSILFSFYIENFASYSYIYGSLAAIVLMMLWVYFCMIIFLVGGEINYKLIINRIQRKREHNSRLKFKEIQNTDNEKTTD